MRSTQESMRCASADGESLLPHPTLRQTMSCVFVSKGGKVLSCHPQEMWDRESRAGDGGSDAGREPQARVMSYEEQVSV